MSPVREVDVLIVGIGPVGAALGCLLGQYGVTTLIVDRMADISLAPRAIALDNEALRILQMVGLADDAFEKLAIPQVRMHCPYVGEFACFNTAGTLDEHPKLSTFYQPDLERALHRKLETYPSVSTLRGVEMEEFFDTGDSVRVTVQRADGQRAEIRAKYLVGADGAGSTVRRAIGQEFSGHSYSEDWLIVDAQDVPGTFDHVEFICDPKRPTPHMVAPGGRVRWEFMLRPGESRADMEKDETIHRLLEPWANSTALKIERKAVYRFHARSCEKYSKGRVFLVGDAAHITPPFVGQGLVSGLRDAANLGWKLAWTLRGLAMPTLLDSYDRERRPHAAKMIALAKFMGRVVMPRHALSAIVIHGAMRAIRFVPGARAFIEDLGAKPKNRFPDGLFVRGRGRMIRGGSLAQGLVRRASGECLRSDEVLGPHLMLVGFGVDPDQYLDATTRSAWRAHGGRIVHFWLGASHGAEACEDLNGALVSGTAPHGWCAVIRPDRQILHDGPVRDAKRLVHESIALLNVGRAPGDPV